MSPMIKKPFMIAVSGGPCSGKSQVCDIMTSKLAEIHDLTIDKVSVLKITDFYKQLSSDEYDLVANGSYNFEHPDAIDWELLETTIVSLSNPQPNVAISIPQYDLITNQRLSSTLMIKDVDVIIIQGIHMLYSKTIRDCMDLKVFVDVDSDVRLSHLVIKDTTKGIPLNSILSYYMKHVKPTFEEYIITTKKYADLVIPRGHENMIAIELMTQEIMHRLVNGNMKSGIFKSLEKERSELFLAIPN